MNSPLVSVIIIFLNAERFMRDAIESVLAQTYRDWELFLVDDGSTDGSTDIARQCARTFPGQVYYLEHEGHRNRGMSASRNLGVANAGGEFLAFLDADDVWLPEKLEKQVKSLEHHSEAGLTASCAWYWYEDGTQARQPMTLPPGLLPAGAWLPKILTDDSNAACPSAVLIRRDLMKALGGFEESFTGPLMVVEDQAMWFKATLAAPIYFEPECLLNYRIHSASCCGSTSPATLLRARLRLYAWLLDYLKTHGGLPAITPWLTRIVRSKLCTVLFEYAGHSSASGVRDGWLASRFGVEARSIREFRRLLGPLFSCLVLLGAVSRRTGSALAERMFLLSTIVNAQGWSGAVAAQRRLLGTDARDLARFVSALPRYLARPIRRLLRRVLMRFATAPLRLIRIARARVRLGAGLAPLSYRAGVERGTPLHRHYIRRFLREFAVDIRGHCLEFQDPLYAHAVGGAAVTKLDILHVDDSSAHATLIADLTKRNDIPNDRFDCIICTQVLNVIPDVSVVIRELHRILKPGGVLLVAVPHVLMCAPEWHEIWRYTPEGLTTLLGNVFGADNVTVRVYGSSLTAAGEIRGLVAEEFTEAELGHHDARSPVEVCARAIKG